MEDTQKELFDGGLFPLRPLSEGMGLGTLQKLAAQNTKVESIPPPTPQPRRIQQREDLDRFEQEKKQKSSRSAYLPWHFKILAHFADMLIVLPLAFFLIVGIGSLAYTERWYGINRMFEWLVDRDFAVLILGLYGLFFLYYTILKVAIGKTVGSLLFSKQARTPLPLP